MGVLFRQSFKGSLVTLFGGFIGFAITFFVLTRYLSPEEIGLIRIITEAATLISSFALLGLQTSAIRYYPYFKTADGSDKGYGKLLFAISTIGIILFGFLFYIMREPIVSYFSNTIGKGGEGNSEPFKAGGSLFENYAWMIIPLMSTLMYLTVGELYASVHQRVVIPKLIREVLLRLFLGCGYILFGVGVIRYFPDLMYYYLACHMLCVLLGLFYLLKLTPQITKARIILPSNEIRRDFLTYSGLTLLSALGSNLATRLDLFMVSSGMGMDFAGVFAIAFTMASVIEMPGRALISMSGPLVSVMMHSDDIKGLRSLYFQVSQQQLLVGGVVFLFIWNNIDLIFHLIPNGHLYIQGKWVFLLLGFAKLIELAFSFGNSILRYSKFYAWSLAYTFLVTFLSIWLNSLLIPRFGMEGAALATILTLISTYTFQQVILWSTMRLSPLQKDLAYIFLILILVWLAEHFVLSPYIGGLSISEILFKNLFLVLISFVLFWKSSPFKQLFFKTKDLLRKL